MVGESHLYLNGSKQSSVFYAPNVIERDKKWE
jgi:hypothetical protein